MAAEMKPPPLPEPLLVLQPGAAPRYHYPRDDLDLGRDQERLCICGLVPALKETAMGTSYSCCPKRYGDASRCAFYHYVSSRGGEDQKDDVPTCLCNLKSQKFQVKKEGPTKGIWFYSCHLPVGHPERCRFWQQVDGPAYEPMTLAPEAVLCVCGNRAGMSKKRTPGLNLGRSYYACLNNRCKFFTWAN